MRQEGTAEPAGDIIIQCQGMPVGQQTGVMTLSLYTSAPIASRQLYTGATPDSIPTDAVLIIGNNGVESTANAVQGFLQDGVLVFTGFTLPAGSVNNNQFSVRLTNLRINASAVSLSWFVTGTVLATFPIQNQAGLVLGAVQPTLSALVSGLTCAPASGSVVDNITIAELVNTAFKSPAFSTASNGTVGAWYQNGVNTESQTSIPSPPASFINQTASVVGQADAATRIRVTFANVPSSVTLSLPSGAGTAQCGTSPSFSYTGTPVCSGSTPPKILSGISATIGGDLGAFSQALGSTVQVVGSGSITYEVVGQNGSGIDSFNLPVTVSYLGSLPPSAVTASVSYAPTLSETSTSIPRFVQGNWQSLFNTNCTGTVPVTFAVAGSTQEVPLVIDGQTVNTPATFNWVPGSTHTLDAPIATYGTTRYVFQSWSQGGAKLQTIMVPSSAVTYSANYGTQYYLSTTVAGNGTLSPDSGWYNAGDTATVTATATWASYFYKAYITSDAAKAPLTSSPFQVPMTSAQTVTAYFNYPSIGATMQYVGPQSGTNSVMVNSAPGWTATPNVPWLHISGIATPFSTAQFLTYTFDANPGATRSGTISFSGYWWPLTVTQAGAGYAPVTTPISLLTPGLISPSGIAADGAGSIYFSDSGTNVIKSLSLPAQSATSLLGGYFTLPSGLAAGYLTGGMTLLTAQPNGTYPAVQMYRVQPPNLSFAGSWSSPSPQGVALSSIGEAFYDDASAGSVYVNGVALASGLYNPHGLATDSYGNVYIADTGSNTIKFLAGSNLSTLVSAGLNQPAAVTVDGAGNVYIADASNTIKKWSMAASQLTTVASGFNSPSGLASENFGTLYIADTGNNAIKMLPAAFVYSAPLAEPAAAGYDSLPDIVPGTSLIGAFAPSSDQPWLTISPTAYSPANFNFTANTGPTTRIAHITILGVTTTITQAGTATTAASVTATAGSSQSANIQTSFSASLSALVTDAAGNPLNGVTVTFTAPSAGASATLTGSTAVTNHQGLATVSATANSVVGTYNVTAAVNSLSTTFTLTNAAGVPASIAVAGGSGQSAVVNTGFSNPVSVIVKDAVGNLVSGASVTFTAPATGASATLSNTTVNTNASGIATVTATANTIAGAYNVAAAVNGLSTNVTLTNAPGVPAAIAVNAGTNQSAALGTAFATPLSAIVRDQYGNPATGGAFVTFAAPTTGASVTFTPPGTTVTNNQGIAIVGATANFIPGPFNVTATVSGISTPATFSLNNVGPPGKLVFSAVPTSGTPGSPLTPAPAVKILDAAGNPTTSTASVILISTPAGVNAAVAAVNGTATFGNLIFPSAGSYTLAATSTGLTGATSGTIVIAGLPAVSIDAPAAGSTLVGTVTLSGWALDSATGIGTAIKSVQVSVDGAPIGNATYSLPRPEVCTTYPGRPGCPNVGFSYQLNSVALSNGTHTITVSATNSDATPQTGSASVAVTVANPQIQVLPPLVVIDPVSTAVAPAMQTVTGYAVGRAAGTIAKVQVSIDNNPAVSATYGLPRPDACSAAPAPSGCPNIGFSYSLDPSTLSAGSHKITVTATDQWGNSSSSTTTLGSGDPPSTFTVAIESPHPSAAVSGLVTVSGWAVNLTHYAVQSVQVKLDGTVMGAATYGQSRPDVCAIYSAAANCPNVGFTYQLNTAALGGGTHTLTVTAADASGKTASASEIITTPTAPPAVYVEAPSPGAFVSDKLNVTGWAMDAGTPDATAISTVQIQVDGTPVGTATYGLKRTDICANGDPRPGCPNVGFTYALDTTALTPGPHFITAIATDSDPTPDSTSWTTLIYVKR
jgi:hypothetical protein